MKYARSLLQGCVFWESEESYFDCFNKNIAQVNHFLQKESQQTVLTVLIL